MFCSVKPVKLSRVEYLLQGLGNSETPRTITSVRRPDNNVCIYLFSGCVYLFYLFIHSFCSQDSSSEDTYDIILRY